MNRTGRLALRLPPPPSPGARGPAPPVRTAPVCGAGGGIRWTPSTLSGFSGQEEVTTRPLRTRIDKTGRGGAAPPQRAGWGGFLSPILGEKRTCGRARRAVCGSVGGAVFIGVELCAPPLVGGALL